MAAKLGRGSGGPQVVWAWPGDPPRVPVSGKPLARLAELKQQLSRNDATIDETCFDQSARWLVREGELAVSVQKGENGVADGPDNAASNASRRYCILFDDRLLVAKRASAASLTHEITMNLADATLNLDLTTHPPSYFDLRATSGTCVRVWCAAEKVFMAWLLDLRALVLRAAARTDDTTARGWRHKRIRGTLHAEAMTGDDTRMMAYFDAIAQAGDEAVSEVNLRDEDGMTPLHLACAEGRLSTVTILLSHGAAIDAANNAGDTPAHIAAQFGHEHILAHLLKHQQHDINRTGRQDRRTPLHVACLGGGRPALVRMLLDAGAQPNLPDACGMAALQLCLMTRVKTVKELIAHTRETACLLLAHGARAHLPETGEPSPDWLAAAVSTAEDRAALRQSAASYAIREEPPVDAEGDTHRQLLMPEWEPDEASDVCPSCRAEFTFFMRRHHCRACGRLACAECSSKLFTLGVRSPDVDGDEAVPLEPCRVCDACFNRLSVLVTVNRARGSAWRIAGDMLPARE